MKASEKFRFNFDWDNKEDTSRDLNPLYNNLHRKFGPGALLWQGFSCDPCARSGCVHARFTEPTARPQQNDLTLMTAV